MRSLRVLVLMAALYIAAGPVFVSRAVADDLDTCAAVAGEEAIAACTRAISSGRLHDHDLAAEYYNRGIKYSSKGDYDRAIADYTEAIKLDPTFARAYYNRGFAKRAKGDSANASADIAKAMLLNPKVGN